MSAQKHPGFDPLSVTAEIRNPYPAPNANALDGKSRRALGDSRGLTKFGVNLTDLEPGAVSALRHWHGAEDEFIYIVEGDPVLVSNAGEQQLAAGMCACFPAGSRDAHRLENRSEAPVRFLEVGNRSDGEEVFYPDDNMILRRTADGTRSFKKLDGSPY
jgi:uncharacterized cupin superfamily protein